jgi:hypothetical protein
MIEFLFYPNISALSKKIAAIWVLAVACQGKYSTNACVVIVVGRDLVSCVFLFVGILSSCVEGFL